MRTFTEPTDRKGEVRLSRRLATMHIAGVALLIFVVVISLLWVSAEHNRLARRSSEQLVASGLAGLRNSVDTLVRDYSIWDEAYNAARADNRAWLYDNIGNAVTKIGTLDLIHFHDPLSGARFGWLRTSPENGDVGLLPPDLEATLYDLLDPGPARAILARLNGEIWVLSVAAVTPVEGVPANTSPSDLPRQIHGRRLSQERLDALAESLLIDSIVLTPQPNRRQATLPLLGPDGDVLVYAAWTPPYPGGRILSNLAAPLAGALALVAGLAFFSARVAVRSARRLELALDAAQEADQMKSDFLSNVTHELRTPMNGVMGVAQLLEMTPLDAEQRELLAVLEASARAQMSLIGDLLDFTRLEAGQRGLTQAPFLPIKVLDEISAMIGASAAGKAVRFETDWSSLDKLVVRGDGRAFRQIVTNLLGNAIKFTPEGLVTAGAELTVTEGEARIVVVVRDTGVGIPETELERIFDRFYRVDSTMARSTDGAGLGLAISLRLAQLMGGDITVESTLDVGSTFRFSLALPVIESVAEAQQAA